MNRNQSGCCFPIANLMISQIFEMWCCKYLCLIVDRWVRTFDLFNLILLCEWNENIAEIYCKISERRAIYQITSTVCGIFILVAVFFTQIKKWKMVWLTMKQWCSVAGCRINPGNGWIVAQVHEVIWIFAPALNETWIFVARKQYYIF